MKRSILFWLLFVGASTGCVTVAELRQAAAVRTGTVAGVYRPLATCVRDALGRNQAAEGMTYQFEDLASTKAASILGATRLPAGIFYTVSTPLLELSFRQTEGDNVTIEARRTLAGLDLELRAWPIVERCAGKTVVVSPPLT